MSNRIASLRKVRDLMAQTSGNALTKRLSWIRQSVTFIEGMAPYNESTKTDLINELQTIAQTAQDAVRVVMSGSLSSDPRFETAV